MPPETGWLVAGVVVLTLLQLLIYRYLRERQGSSPVTGRNPQPKQAQGTDGRSASASVVDREEDRDFANVPPDSGSPAQGRRCSACGAVNDPSFTFCRHCVSRLGTQPM